MKFSIIDGLAGKDGGKKSVIYWLSGLTCSDRNFIEKAGAFEAAVQCGVAIVCPDTSPRGVDIEGDSDNWDFGKGLGPSPSNPSSDDLAGAAFELTSADVAPSQGQAST
jgi:S-formylglutathione hydrolase FrmB